MNGFIVLIWFISICMVIIYLIYISLYGHYLSDLYLSIWSLFIWFISFYMVIMWGPQPSICAFAVALLVLYFLYNYIYIIFNIVPYWSRSQFICAKSIILILSANDTYSRLWYRILNYVGSLKNYDRYNGAKRLLWDLKVNFLCYPYYSYE